MAPWIISHIPADHYVYIEPFGGSAAVLLRKDRSPHEVYNDLDGEVVNFFQVLREQSEELIEQIRLTPFAYEEWENAQTNDVGAGLEPALDPVEQARRFYVRSWQSIAGPTAQYNSGWRRQKIVNLESGGVTPAAQSFAKTDHLYAVAERLRGVQIESLPALEVLDRYDSDQALFYLDPPYVHETRSMQWAGKGYAHEMSDLDHRELLIKCQKLEAQILISGYRNELYDDLLSHWRRVDKNARTQREERTESLWLSPSLTDSLQ